MVRLFLSVDMAGSTQFKARFSDGGGWLEIFRSFFTNFPLMLAGQVGFAFLGGTIFYILRRTTGTLIWAMVLHGFWDFSSFAVGYGTPGAFAGVAQILYFVTGVLALVAVAFVIRGADERTAPPPTTPVAQTIG